jgi:hypothetical protein
MNSIIPLKKKESPTVTMMTARIGSPMSLSRKILSTRIPRITPMIKVQMIDRTKGMPA